MVQQGQLKKNILGSLILLVTVLILGTMYHDYRKTYAYNHPLLDSRYGFQFLKPTKLPNGFKITASRINVFSEAGKIYGISAEMNLRNVDWVYEIREGKDVGLAPKTILHDFNSTSMQVTCEQDATPQGRSYRLCHWIDYGTISVYEVEFVRDGVFVRTTFPAKLNTEVSIASLGGFVDSFVPANAPSTIVRGI
jgi:hypothetical protein